MDPESVEVQRQECVANNWTKEEVNRIDKNVHGDMISGRAEGVCEYDSDDEDLDDFCAGFEGQNVDSWLN